MSITMYQLSNYVLIDILCMDCYVACLITSGRWYDTEKNTAFR
jgi:hypothetical protein